MIQHFKSVEETRTYIHKYLSMFNKDFTYYNFLTECLIYNDFVHLMLFLENNHYITSIEKFKEDLGTYFFTNTVESFIQDIETFKQKHRVFKNA